MKNELTFGRIEYVAPGNVTRQEIRCELQSRKLSRNAFGNGLARQSFAHAWNIFQKDVFS